MRKLNVIVHFLSPVEKFRRNSIHLAPWFFYRSDNDIGFYLYTTLGSENQS